MPAELSLKPATILAIPEAAHQMALIPFLWLAVLHFRKKDPGVAWWWLAGAFAVSWIADTAAHFTDPWVVSQAYPISQAVIVGLVVLSRQEAQTLIIGLALAAAIDLLWKGIGQFDVLLRTVAWLSIVGIIYPLRPLGRLRTSLLVYFGVGWLCWMGYALWPGWTSWSLYQFTRLLGILLFCWAATLPLPNLKLSRRGT